MSTSQHHDADPATEPDHALMKFLFAWGVALAIGFFGSTIVMGGSSIIGLCIIMAAVVFVMSIIGGNATVGIAATLGVGGLGLVFALLGGNQTWVNGPWAFALGLAGVFGLGVILQRGLNGMLNKGDTFVFVVLAGLLPFALNGLRAFETMGPVGLF